MDPVDRAGRVDGVHCGSGPLRPLPRTFQLLLVLFSALAAAPAAGQGYVPFEDSAEWRPPVRLPAQQGDGAPDLVLNDLAGSGTVNLSGFRGQILCLEFWASWCPSCGPLLDEMNRLAESRREAWKDRVTVAAVSLDAKPESARAATESGGWSALRHLWSPPDLSGRERLAAKAFGVIELPYAVILDTSGTVVWRGNPARTPPGEKIETLLNR